MKKLLGIVVLSLLWCNSANTKSADSFFGISLGGDINKYTKLDCSPCANGTFFRNNFYDIIPPNPNPYFIEYVARTTPTSNLILGIIGSGKYKYVDGDGLDLAYDDPASLFVCKKQMSDLMISLEVKFKKEMPEYKVVLLKERNSIIIKKTNKDMIILFSSCEPKRNDRKIKMYRAEIQIISESLDGLAEKEMDAINLKKSDTKGF